MPVADLELDGLIVNLGHFDNFVPGYASFVIDFAE
jgi:hypothetical protein